MDPLSITASIIAILQLTSTLLEYINAVKDAPTDRAKCAIETSNLYSLLTALRYRVEESRSNEPWFNALKDLGVRNGPLDQYQHVLEQVIGKLAEGAGKGKILDSLIWSLRREDVKNLLVRIERLKGIVSIALAMDHFTLSEAIHSDLGTIQCKAEEIKSDTEAIRKALPIVENRLCRISGDGQWKRILNWISPADFSAQHADIMARRQAGTGLWFLESGMFGTWVQGPKSTLFCPGIPGAGKTIMAAITVDHLLRTKRSNTVGVAFIYCNYKSESDATATGLFAALLRQLVLGQSPMLEEATSLYREHSTLGTYPSLEDISGALLTVLTMYSQTYIVIDALDECSDDHWARTQLIKSLRTLQEKANLCLMFTSRFVPDIQVEFEGVPALEIRATDRDVQSFLEGQIHRLPKCVRRDGDLQNFIKTSIAEAVDGMFLLARLYLDCLLDKRTKAKVRSALENLSQGRCTLDEAYKGAIERIEGQLPGDRNLAMRTVSWIVYAKRPFRAAELCHALAVSEGDSDLNNDNIPDVEDLISVCAGLVVLDHERDVVRLVHYTTQEYFETIGQNWCPSAQLDITSSCLLYLCLEPLKTGPCSNRVDLSKRQEQYPFLNYASAFWGLHAMTVQEDVTVTALRFLQNDDLVCSAVQSCRGLGNARSHQDRGWTGLHLTSHFGLFHLSKSILFSGQDKWIADRPNLNGRTPLSFAAAAGHESIVELLLQHGLNANGGAWTTGTPLSYDSEGGSIDTLDILVEEANVSLNSVEKYGLAPLHYAARGGNKAIVELLIQDERIDVNQKCMTSHGKHHLSALGLAVEHGHDMVVTSLLRHPGVDPNAKGYGGETPLIRAILAGDEHIFRILLSSETIDPNARNEFSPLHWAAWRGHERMLQLLLEHPGTDPNVQDCWGNTPLSAAIKDKQVSVARLLLTSGKLDPNITDKRGETALSTAVTEGYLDVIQLLLDCRSVDPNVQNHRGETPLTVAAVQGYWDPFLLLLGCKRVDPTIENNYGMTALARATHDGPGWAVKYLLQHDMVNSNSQDRNGNIPLHHAVYERRSYIARLLLEFDKVDPNLQNLEGQTPLLAAANEGFTDIVELLLGYEKVDPGIPDYDGRTPLLEAAYQGDAKMVELLLNTRRVDPNSQDVLGRTALSEAMEEEEAEVVKLLLEHGAILS